MGMFSQDCKYCRHPALAPMVTRAHNAWMSKVVVVTPLNTVITGSYDGYGRVGNHELVIGDGNAVYHRDCWEAIGRPRVYAGASPMSADQGFLFEHDDHDYASPDLALAAWLDRNAEADADEGP